MANRGKENKIIKNKQLLPAEREILVEGLNVYSDNSNIDIVFLNLLFRIQLILIPLVIVVGQDEKTIVCLTLIAIETTMLGFFCYLKRTYRRHVFKSWGDFFSYFLVVLTILILSLVGLFSPKWHTETYMKQVGLKIKANQSHDTLTFSIIALIIASIFLEFSKGTRSVCWKE